MPVIMTSDDSTTIDDTAFAVLSAARAVVAAAQALSASISPYMATLLDDTVAGAAQDTLGLLIGRDVQGHDAKLDQIAELVPVVGAVPFFNDNGVADLFSTTAFGRSVTGQANAAAIRLLIGAVGATEVSAAIAQVVGAAPTTLDTLAEINAALNNDPNFASTVMTALAGKQPLDSDLTAIAALTTTTFGRSLLTPADASTARAILALGSAALLTAGTAANNAVQLDANAKLPAVDGSQLTNLPAAAPAFRAVGDAAATFAATDRALALTSALTAGRTWTLAAASGVPAGTSVRVVDLVGGVSSAFPITIARAGADTINGAATHVMGTPYAEVSLISDGVSRWSFDVRGVGRGGTGATTAPAALTNLGALAKAGDQMAGALDFAAAVTVASAATTDIGAAASNLIEVTGTAAITSLGTRPAGAVRFVRFAAAGLVLTYSATALILPTAASITTQAGDTAAFRSLGSGNWLCLSYQRADGTALVAAALTKASGADLRGLTDDTKYLTAKANADAIAFFALGSITGTINLVFSSGFNQSGIAIGNLTLGQHTAGVDGEPVQLEIVQDATGSRTLAANLTYNKFPGGTVYTLSTATGSRDILYGTYRVIGGTSVVHWTGLAKGVA